MAIRAIRPIFCSCTSVDFAAIKVGLEYARIAGLLDSYVEGSALFDGERVVIMLDAGHMDVRDRDSFMCEVMIAERVCAHVVSSHRVPQAKVMCP